MDLRLFREMGPFSRLMFSAFIILAVFLVVQLLAALAAIPVFSLAQLSNMLSGMDISDPENIQLLKFFQVAQSLGLFIIPSFLIAWLFGSDAAGYLCLNQPIKMNQALMVLCLVIVVNPLINFAGALNADMHLPEWLSGLEEWMRRAEDAAEDLTNAFLKVDTLGGLMFNILMIAILPALGEELLFRGVIQKLLTQWSRNHHAGIWLSAALFSALHMQFYGFVPRMLLAGMFGYLLVWSGSLWLPVLAHFINNAGAVISLWLVDQGKISPSLEAFGTETQQWPYAISSLLLSFLIMMILKKQAVPVTGGSIENS